MLLQIEIAAAIGSAPEKTDPPTPPTPPPSPCAANHLADPIEQNALLDGFVGIDAPDFAALHPTAIVAGFDPAPATLAFAQPAMTPGSARATIGEAGSG